MDAKQAAELSAKAASSQEAAASRQAEATRLRQEKAREEARTRAATDIPGILLKVEERARAGLRSLDVYAGHSEQRDGVDVAYGEAVREHMEARGYKAEHVTHEPCNEGQTEDTYYWRFSW